MSNSISRREFLGVSGSVVGLTALASMGLYNGWGENEHDIMDENIGKVTKKVDVLVIGGGMAGLFAAVKAHDAGANVLMVSKGRLGSSGQTPFAKGIFAFNPKTSEYSLQEFVDAVGKSALGTNNPMYTKQMAEHSQARVDELKAWGFFDSPLYNKSFSKPIKERGIALLERVTITNLVKENDRIAGAVGFSIDEQKSYFINAKSVILCTGAGGFKPNGFPINDLSHDGTIMAYNIGAKVTGKEWNDGHPGKAANAAACYDGWGDMFDQKPSTVGVGIRHDLGVELNYTAYKNGSPIMRHGPGSEKSMKVEGGPYRPSGIGLGGNERKHEGPERPKGKKGPKKGDGAPPGMGGTVVGGSSAGMAIHKSEGLVPINDRCESNIKGLYAAGDALGSYMAGAIYTQIGSSLAGSAVQGAIAGEAAAEHAQQIQFAEISVQKQRKIEEEMFAPLFRKSGYSPRYVTQTLQGIIIPNFVLYIKKEKLLQAALSYVEELRDHHVPLLRAADLHELRLVHETVNMIISAEMKLKASLMRKESRCSHYRLDYPDLDNENWQAWINIFKGKDGDMEFEKQSFATPLG